jgi:hypothetical protein
MTKKLVSSWEPTIGPYCKLCAARMYPGLGTPWIDSRGRTAVADHVHVVVTPR